MVARTCEGPIGANLLIYYLPHDLMDAYIAMAFDQLYNIISTKIYVNCITGESEGFGFVFYNSVLSSKHAIDQINGFQISSKRIKVKTREYITTVLWREEEAVILVKEDGGEGRGNRVVKQGVPITLPPLMLRRYGRQQSGTGVKGEDLPSPQTMRRWRRRRRTEER